MGDVEHGRACRSTPRNRVEWVRGEQQLPAARWPARRASTCALAGLDRAAARARSRASRRSTTSSTEASPTPTSALRGAGHARAGARRRAPLAPDDRRRGLDARRPRAQTSACRRRRSTSCRWASARARRRRRRRRRELRAAARRSATRPVLLTVSAKRPHKNLPRLLDALARSPGERRPVLVLPGYPTPHEAELRDARPRRWASPATCVGRRGSRTPSSRACTRIATRSCSRRCTRASGCRCWRRWRAACRWRARTARRCPRWPGDAALLFDPEDAGAIARRDRSGCSTTARERDGCARPGRRRPPAFTWERHRRG